MNINVDELILLSKCDYLLIRKCIMVVVCELFD